MSRGLRFPVWQVPAQGDFMAYSKLRCRLNKVFFPFTMTSSTTRPEGGAEGGAQPTLLPGVMAALLRKLCR